MKFRITRPDPLNWDLEQFQEGGGKISRGRFAGQAKKERWKVIGHYSSLLHAARAMLDKEMGENWSPDLTFEQMSDILSAAEARISQAVADLTRSEAPKDTNNANDLPGSSG